MKKKIMQEWVALLRSGEFEQCQMKLEKDGKYCCLGVLCQLAIVEGICEVDNTDGKVVYYGEDMSYGCLPSSVMKWAGMKSVLGELEGKDALYRLNDIQKKSFVEIADYIETNYKEL